LSYLRDHASTRMMKRLQELSSSWDGRPFGHNRHWPKRADGLLLRVGIPLRATFIPSLVFKTFTVRVHWV